ncbi:MAG: leucine-rich repeat protein, partial [Eubacteriales bacterium]|nr:leucine-rich repeat protein [Eubacteriales bacterium]
MKKFLATLLALVMLATTVLAVPFSAQAEVKYPEASGTLLSDQTFTYDSITETLTISGEGAITGYYWTGENASPFQYCTVKHIVIEEGITSLCNYLFHTVYGIESFSIPASLTTIAYYAINYCTFVGGAGKGFTVADGNESFCADEGTLYNKDKTRLIKFVNSDKTEFTVPKTVSSIAFEAFYSDVTLKKLVLNGTNLVLQDYAIRGAKIEHLEINEGVKDLGDFSSIDSSVWADETITLPASLTNIDTQSLFDDKNSIKNFVVAGGNPVFSAIDGVLYKDGTTLFSYPCGRTDTSYIVPDSTTKIAYNAFTWCDNLETIDFPASVKTFSSRSLSFCSNITTVNIRALDAEFLATDCFYNMNSSVVYNVYENSVTHKNLLDNGIEESKFAFFPLCAEHSYQLTKTVEPTCYAKGYDLYTCSVCGTTENRNETNMVDHEVVTTYNQDKTIEHHKCKNFAFVIEETENLPESEHDYQSSTNEYYELSYPGVDTISITFDDQFKTETKYDYLMAYDREGNEIAKYTGTAPADQTYTLNGDYIKLNFHSDGSNEYYGFKITRVVAEKVGCDYAEPDTPHTHNYGDYVSDGNATCTENGTETATCAC